MTKKIYLLIGALVIIVAAAVGVLWHYQASKSTSTELLETQKLTQEIENLSQDILDLETIAEDKNLDTLEEDMSAISGETPLEQELSPTPTVSIDEIENLENELSIDLEGISNDLTDLGEFEEDSSLEGLDASLSGLAE